MANLVDKPVEDIRRIMDLAAECDVYSHFHFRRRTEVGGQYTLTDDNNIDPAKSIQDVDLYDYIERWLSQLDEYQRLGCDSLFWFARK
ncbi:hypothetical protein [Coxiella-like endosymbiont]|uniref:hypothetical protein n=1 Tax=Coxiella-like endosymbiont TaxID=1592897 RepID=UPI0034E1C759